MSNQNIICQTLACFHADWPSKAIEGTVPFKGDVDVAKFMCGLLISVPSCVH